jgi:hypothetical protein
MRAKEPKTYKTPMALRAALDARARASRRETGENLQLIRRRYAFEAFLRRIGRSAQPLVLKGGYLLHSRYAIGARLTHDLDAALNDPTLAQLDKSEVSRRMRAALQEVVAVPDADFFAFEISQPQTELGFGREFIGFRFSVTARLDQHIFDIFQVDCTVGDALVLPLTEVKVGELFRFAGLPLTSIYGISAAQHVAEKLHALCRDRGVRENNRVKDLVDIVLFAQQGVTPQDVAAVIGDVFEVARNTPFERLAKGRGVGAQAAA